MAQCNAYFRNEDDDGAQEEGEQPEDYKTTGRDCLIFLVDASKEMFIKGEDGEPSNFDVTMQVVRNVYTRTIISSPGDLVALVFYGTKQSKDPTKSFKHVYVYHSLSELGAKRVQQVDALCGEKGALLAAETMGSDETSLCDALWCCANLYRDCKLRLGHKTLLIFTCRDQPHGGDSTKDRQARTQASDLRETGVVIELMHLKKAGGFDVSLFFRDVVTPPEDESDLGLQIEPCEKLEDLQKRVRAKELRKRTIARLNLCLGEGVSVAVGMYSIAVTARKPNAIRLHRESNEPVRSKTRTFHTQAASLLLPSEIKKAQEKEHQEEEHVREVTHHVTPPGHPKHHENRSDDGPTKRKKKQRKDCRILDRAVEDSLVEFFRKNELLWNSQKTDYRNKAKRQRILETKATELQISVDHLWTWFKSLRDMFTKMDKKKSGDGQKQLTERETWIKDKFGFFHHAINHRSKPFKSLKPIIAESQGDLDKAERAAAEERVEVDEFDVNVTERQPSQASSVSSNIATLQRKSKESGDLLTMLRDQLPPPEPVTERTTYAAYVKSVLLGLSLKDFRRARKGINKVLKPFCESESSDEDSENRSNRPPSRQDTIQSCFTGDTPSSQPPASKKQCHCQDECQSQQGGWQQPPSEWGTPTPQPISVFNSADSAYISIIPDQQGCESNYRKY